MSPGARVFRGPPTSGGGDQAGGLRRFRELKAALSPGATPATVARSCRDVSRSSAGSPAPRTHTLELRSLLPNEYANKSYIGK